MEAHQNRLTTSIGLLVLRLGTGGYMLTSGWGKLQMLLAGGGAEFGDPIGLGPSTSLLLVTFAEFGCALLVMVGLATRLAAVPVVVTMAVAAFVAHGNDPWTTARAAELVASGAAKSMASKQPALMFLIPFLALIFTGAGEISLDSRIRKRWRERRATT